MPDEVLEKYMSGVVCYSREGHLKQRKQHTEGNVVFCISISPGFT